MFIEVSAASSVFPGVFVPPLWVKYHKVKQGSSYAEQYDDETGVIVLRSFTMVIVKLL
jgi:hypothetical protein